MNISSSIETVDEITRKLVVAIPAVTVTKEFDDALLDLSRTVALKGFRPGKAPKNVVERMHGERLRIEVAQRLIASTIDKTVKENSLEMVGYPDVDVEKVEAGADLKFTAQISLLPRPAITSYDTFSITVVKREPTSEDIDKVIEGMRESKSTTRPLAFRTVIAKGDIANIIISVTVNGDAPSPHEPLSILVGEGRFPKELEAALVGMDVGQSKAVEAVIGTDHPNEQLRGKKALYNLTLSSVSERILPELTDEFAATLELGAATLLDLRMKVRERLEEQMKKESKAEIQAEILNKLVDANQFPVPQVMIDEEIKSMLIRAGVLDTAKVDPQRISVEPFREKLGESAIRRVRTAIAVDRIAELEKVAVLDEDVEKSIGEIAAANNATPEEVRKVILRGDQGSGLRLEISRNKVIELLELRTSVSYREPDKLADAEKGSESV